MEWSCFVFMGSQGFDQVNRPLESGNMQNMQGKKAEVKFALRMAASSVQYADGTGGLASPLFRQLVNRSNIKRAVNNGRNHD